MNTTMTDHRRLRRRIVGGVMAAALVGGTWAGAASPAAQAASHGSGTSLAAAISKAEKQNSPGGTAVVPSEATQAQRLHIYTSVADLNATQKANADLIIKIGKDSDQIPAADKANAIHAALMAAMQESSLTNLNYGDADSLGLFQQRPSQGWGTADQIMDPTFAIKSFYGINPDVSTPGVIDISGWQTMDPGELAQAVQRSAYPDAYNQWYDLAVELLNDYPNAGSGGSSDTTFTTWPSAVNVRAAASASSTIVKTLTVATSINVTCQTQGDTVSYGKNTPTNWWGKVPAQGGYISVMFIDQPNTKLANVPDC